MSKASFDTMLMIEYSQI